MKKNYKYEWLFFDADQTLFDFKHSQNEALKGVFKLLDLDFNSVNLEIYSNINHQIWTEFEEGKITSDKISVTRFTRFLQAIRRQGSPEKISDLYISNLAMGHKLLDGALQLIKSLHEDFNLLLITNGLKNVQRSRFELSPVSPYFKNIIISEEVGYAKPDTGIFNIAFNKAGDPLKSKVLMIGDSISSDILGGVNYGIDTCWYNPSKLINTQNIIPDYEIYQLQKLKDFIY